jgi:hypothetical protein
VALGTLIFFEWPMNDIMKQALFVGSVGIVARSAFGFRNIEIHMLVFERFFCRIVALRA